jgi:hypothetical protein
MIIEPIPHHCAMKPSDHGAGMPPVAREYGVPAVLGTGVATHRMRGGQQITVDGDGVWSHQVDEICCLCKPSQQLHLKPG